MEKFLYFGKNPTNVSTRGTSFPVYNGDVIAGEREFLSTQIDPKWLKPLPADDKRKVRHSFKKQTDMFAKDPTGGLPMTSTFGRAPKTKKLERTPFMTETDTEFVNPYSITKDKRKLEVTTDIAMSAFLKVEKGVEIDNKDKVETKEVVLEEEFGSAEEVDEVIEVVEAQEPLPPQSKSALRKEGAGVLKKRFSAIVAAGAPARPDMLESMKEINMEEATKGIVFPLVWEYYSFNEEE